MPFNRFKTLSQIFSALILGSLFLRIPAAHASKQSAAAFSQISFVANIETAGVIVSGASLPNNAQLSYRQSGDQNWRTGQPLVQIPDGRLVGSLFNLLPATTYEVKVTDGTTEISGTVTTQPDALLFAPTTVLYVDSHAQAGGNGSASAPFQKIQDAVNQAGPGTQILVADGVYHESVAFPKSGAANNWIQVKAAGSGAILDGSVDLADVNWKPHATKKNVFFIKTSPITYLGRDQKRFYNYDDLSGLTQGLGHNGVPISEGWYYEPGTSNLYIRSLSDPSKHSWQFPTLSDAFEINGQDWIWIEGFEIRFYGANYGCGICATNASHVVIRLNKIHNIQLGVFTNWTGGDDRGNDTRIEYNEIYDPFVTDWPWAALKATSMEGTAIVLRGHAGAIVRGNDLHNIFNGIYTGTSASSAIENPEVAFDSDIYNNLIHAIVDDGLEPEGANVNARFRNNTVDSSLTGISIAPVTQGPTWVLRNLFKNFTGTSIKWDLGSDGIVFIYHNTSWTNVPNLNAMSLIHPVHNSVMRNNIFQGNGYAFAEPFAGSTGHDWNYDDWYTTRGANGPHFQWENVDYNTIASLCSATGLECNGFEDAPGFSNPNSGDFTLIPGSPNIDRGVLIPGIDDNFSGAAPDLGAFEYGPQVPPAVQSITRADANPTNAASVNFAITFSRPVTGVDANDFTLTTSGVTGASIANVSLVSGTTYSVNVNTGAGSGTIRLNLIDNDSIVDNANTPLGGIGAGNGNFNSGETYTIDKTIATVLNITRADANPTSANSVHFTVNFSAPVSGVDASDFVLTTTGSISGASVTDVSGSGSTYTTTVNTGSGDGTLRLDLVDNDSILNSMNVPLGGTGAGNGNFNSGEVYTVNKNAPAVTSILRADPDPTSADSVRFLVSFSEPVTGVDASDFSLSVNGISNAAILNISGAGSQYVVTVATGNGSGTLRLDLFDNDSILDAGGLPLGGAGAGNGNFTGGETYMVNKPVVTLITQNFSSNGADDGWILESSQNSNKGGTKNSNGTIINLGDDSRNRQYRAILEFPTSSLPDNAVITSAILMIKRQGLIGIDPFTTNGNILIDIRKGAFGSFGPFPIPALLASDFQAPADKGAVGMITNNPVSGWYWATLDATAFPYINSTGITQFRLRFQLDDNNNNKDDYLKFFSGNYGTMTDRPQLQVTYYVPQHTQITPVSIPTTQAFGPRLKWTTGSQGVSWAEVSFDDLAPHGMNLKECWDAMGMDAQGRIYIGFTSLRADGRDDFAVFRYSQATGERVFLGSFLDIVAASGNAQAGENIPKGHTRMVYTNGQLYMGSQNFHDLKGAIDSLPTYRGSHLFDYDTTSGLWKDLSSVLPDGVVTLHEGIISLNFLARDHLLIGLAHPSSNIILYDYQAEKLINVLPGIPWKLGNPLSREVIVAPSGDIYTYRGTEDVSQLNETHSVWVTNIHTGETRDTGFQMTKGFWVGQTEKRDGSKIYINTIGGELYEFDAATETFRDLGYELPPTDNRTIDYNYSVTLSPDETRLYYVVSILQKPAGALGNGGSGELYYYDIASRQVVFVQQLPIGIYTSADLRDSQNIYFAHFGDTSNLWSGNPRLFILHISA